MALYDLKLVFISIQNLGHVSALGGG